MVDYFVQMKLQVVISEEYCAMYDVCGKRSDGVVLNCAYGSPSVEVSRLVLVNWIPVTYLYGFNYYMAGHFPFQCRNFTCLIVA